MILRPYRLVLAFIVIGTAVFAAGLYGFLGGAGGLGGLGAFAPAPLTQGSPDPNTAAAANERDVLVRHLARRPRDGRGWVMLARMDFDADRFAEAAAAYERAIAASPKVAADPLVWCEYADALGMAQGRTLAGQPRELVQRALALDPTHPRALEMAGSAAFEQRDYAEAARYWRQLAAHLPGSSPQHRELVAAIARAEQMLRATTDQQGGPP